MLCFLYIFLFCFFYKVLTNYFNLKRIRELYGYFKTLPSEKSEDIDNRAFETKAEVIELFKRAGIRDRAIPEIELLGYGKAVPYNASAFNSYPNVRKKFFIVYTLMFDESIGTFKRRIKESINPLYWIDLIIFAPKKILDYLELDPKSRSTKILNLVLTFVYWLLGFIFAIFKESFITFIEIYFP